MSCYCLDANVFIDPWFRDYPPHIFPTLWTSISKYKGEFIIIKEIFNEIDPPPKLTIDLKEMKTKYPLRAWLIENGINPISINNKIETASLILERKYQIGSGNTKGASQNDMLLIAYAKLHNTVLVTLEGYQNQRPGKKKNYKIPIICEDEGVEWINYVTFLDRLGISV